MNQCPDPDRITVDVYKDAAGIWAPYDTSAPDNRKINISILSVLNGAHTAVTIHNAAGMSITPQSGNTTVLEDPAVWVEEASSSNNRHIFFYCNRHPNNPASSTVLLETTIPGKSVLQVQGCPYDRHFVFIKLFGKSLALNAIENDPPLPAYRFTDSVLIL